MALIEEVKARIGADRLKRLTNPRGTPTTIDDTLLGYAVTDASAMFKDVYRQTLDLTNAWHVMMGIRLTIAFLEDWIDSERDRVEQLRNILEIECLKNSPGIYNGAPTEANNPFGNELDDWKANF